MGLRLGGLGPGPGIDQKSWSEVWDETARQNTSRSLLDPTSNPEISELKLDISFSALSLSIEPSNMKLILVALPCVSSFFLGLRPAPAPSAQCHVRMVDPEATRDSEGSYEEYIADRASGKTAGGSIEDSAAGYESFEKYNLDFDGGDSGGGVVGDGNTDLEDQHNSASIVRSHSQPSP